MRNNATHQEKLEYFISNIENYPIDPEGNFFNIDPENFGTDYYYIGRGIFSPKDYEKIDKSLTNKILENKEDWEIVFREHSYKPDEPLPYCLRNKRTKMEFRCFDEKKMCFRAIVSIFWLEN